jgi:ATP-dependent Clp protease ATP-binding subunit ClpA
MRCFDIAVQSRIRKFTSHNRSQRAHHFPLQLTTQDIAIKYDELDSDQQYAIYQSFLEQLKRKKLVENYENLMQWVKKEGKKYSFNGRQIRNVVSTAMNIALVDQEGSGKLKREHLIRVATKMKEFKQDLKAEENSFKKSQ